MDDNTAIARLVNDQILVSHHSSNMPPRHTVHTIIMDFDGVFTDNKVYVDQNGVESVCCDRGDGLAFDLVRAMTRRGELEVTLFILSKEPNPVVMARASKLGITCFHGVDNKLDYLKAMFAETRPSDKTPLSGVVYLGNDLNDLPTMRRVGFSVAPADAHPMVKDVASLVLAETGGNGFVRAFIERFLNIYQMTQEKIDELILDC